VEPVIATLRSRGDEGVEPELRRAGFDIRVLGAGSWPATARAMADLAGSVRPDLIHTMLYRATIHGRVAGAVHRVPVITSLVNTVYASPPATVTAHRRKQEAARALDRLTAKTNAAFHAVSDAVRRDAIAGLRVPPDRVVVIRRGRDADRLGRPSAERRAKARVMLDLDDDQPVIVFVARHEAQKDHPTLLRAIAGLVPRHPRLAVLMVGREGPTTASIRATCTELGLDGHVRWLGHRGDVAEVLAAADVFTLATHHEGMPGAAIEAMALGLPVVATDIPPVREVVDAGASALVYPDDDPAALERALDTLLGDAALRERFGRRGREIFESEFTMAASADRTVALYEAVAGRRPLPQWSRSHRSAGTVHGVRAGGLAEVLERAADHDWVLVSGAGERLADLGRNADERLAGDGDVGAVEVAGAHLFLARALRVSGAAELRLEPRDLSAHIARWGYTTVRAGAALDTSRYAAAPGNGPDVSVVIPTRNRAASAVETVRAVLAQEGPSFEVVVVDDGSTDGTADAIGQVAAEDTRVRLVRRDHGGVSEARNAGMAAATGRVVVLLDDDDTPEPGWLAAFTEAFDDPATGLVSCACHMDRPGRVSGVSKPRRYGLIEETALFIAGCYAFRRDLLAGSGGFDTGMVHGENTEFGYRLALECQSRSLRLATIDRPLITVHRDFERTRGRAKLESIDRMIDRHAALFDAKPRARSRWAAVAAVDGAREGNFRDARRVLLGAIRHDPWYVRNLGRLAVLRVPPLAARVWAPRRAQP
jgi:glycosyltransferase involved in cell wall biosynthesis